MRSCGIERATRLFVGQQGLNQWHLVEAFVKLNTISNKKGMQDGIIRVWINGNLAMSHENILFRTGQHPDLKFNQLMIAPYIGDGSPVEQTFWIDDLVVAQGGR